MKCPARALTERCVKGRESGTVKMAYSGEAVGPAIGNHGHAANILFFKETTISSARCFKAAWEKGTVPFFLADLE